MLSNVVKIFGIMWELLNSHVMFDSNIKKGCKCSCSKLFVPCPNWDNIITKKTIKTERLPGGQHPLDRSQAQRPHYTFRGRSEEV